MTSLYRGLTIYLYSCLVRDTYRIIHRYQTDGKYYNGLAVAHSKPGSLRSVHSLTNVLISFLGFLEGSLVETAGALNDRSSIRSAPEEEEQ